MNFSKRIIAGLLSFTMVFTAAFEASADNEKSYSLFDINACEIISVEEDPAKSFPAPEYDMDSLPVTGAKRLIPITVTAVDKATGKEIPVEEADVTLYIDGVAVKNASTNSEGQVLLSTEGLSPADICKATVSASKIVSRQTAIDGSKRDALFGYFPHFTDTDGNDSYIRTEYELCSDSIDQNGNWVGESIHEHPNQCDIVFAIDATGSMGGVINNVKNNIRKFSEAIVDQGIDIRFSIIEYRDITCKEATKLHTLRGSHWYEDVESIETILGDIKATGGGDTPESAVDALGQVASNKMFWRSNATKFAFLFTDANHKNENNYGYDTLEDVANVLRNKDIITSVVTKSSYVKDYDCLKRTGGQIYDTISSSSFYSELKSLSDSIISYTYDEKKLVLSEPRIRYNMSVSYLADDETSQSAGYQQDLKKVMNEYAKCIANATDGHVMINKVILLPAKSRMDFFSTTALPAMADIQIQTRLEEGTKNHVTIHSNAYLGGYYSVSTVSSNTDLDKFSSEFKDKSQYTGKQKYMRIQMSGQEGAGWNYKFNDDAIRYAETLTHESGHYLLMFFDEYLNSNGDCWKTTSKPINGNYGLMDNQHNSIELSNTENEYSYFGVSIPTGANQKHTKQSSKWKMSTEDMLAKELNDGFFDFETQLGCTATVFNSPYEAKYTKCPAGVHRYSEYPDAGLVDTDFIILPASASGASASTTPADDNGAEIPDKDSDLPEDAELVTESLGKVSVKAKTDVIALTIDSTDETLLLYVKKLGDADFKNYKLTKDDVSCKYMASVPFASGDLAEMRIVGTAGSKHVYNEFFIDRSDSSDKGYVYSSIDNCVNACLIANPAAGFTVVADNTDYTNGLYRSVNQATVITADNDVADIEGEIYSVASKYAEIDYTSLTWFKCVDGEWTAMDTLHSTDESLNRDASAKINGAGLYVLMAKLPSDEPVAAVTNLKYTQSTERDAVVTLTFDDSNENAAYYNIYYSDEPLISKNGKNVITHTFSADSKSLDINLIERNRKVYASVEVVLEDGRRSPLSDIILIGGEADSDNDGIPDWYCTKYNLWPKAGETKDIANSDDDKDGFTNYEEYIKGSDPKDPNDPVVQKTIISVKSVSVDITEKKLNIKESFTINATMEPADATNKNIVWIAEDETVVSLKPNGYSCEVTAIDSGDTIVSAVSEDGGYAGSCAVSVNDLATPAISPNYTATASTLGISWGLVENAESYSVSYKVSGTEIDSFISSGETVRTAYLVTGLKPNTEYDVKVTAIGKNRKNQKVTSDSEPVIFKTKAATYTIDGSGGTTLEKAVSSIPSTGDVTILVTGNSNVGNLKFPGKGSAKTIIEGNGSTLSFNSNAKFAPRDRQTLIIYGLTIKAGKASGDKAITITAAGDLTLDKVKLQAKSTTISASKSNLYLDTVDTAKAGAVTLKGGKNSTATITGNSAATTVSGFGKLIVDKGSTFTVTKGLNVTDLVINAGGTLVVKKGVKFNVKNISGEGTITLETGFNPLSITGSANGHIILKCSKAVEPGTQLFASNLSTANLSSVFDLTGITVSGGEYFLSGKSGKVILNRVCFLLNGAEKFSDWSELMNAITKKNKPKNTYTVTVLCDVNIGSSFKLPAKNKYNGLTITASSTRTVTFSGTSISLTGNLKLERVKIVSTKKKIKVNKGKYTLSGSSYISNMVTK